MATKTTIEAPIKEQTIQSEIESQMCETVIANTDEAQPVSDENIANDNARLDKEGILNRLAEKVAEEPSAELRNEVEALKVAFYKLHRADMEARRKAFFEENGSDAEYKVQTDEAREDGFQIGLEQGEQRMGALNKYLISDHRYDDLERVADDVVYRKVLFQQYGIA